MGGATTEDAKAGGRYLGGGSDVYLNVYDIQTPEDPEMLPRLNDYLYRTGLGVYHSAICVHGVEFAFGGHFEAGVSGIFEVSPGECSGVKYRTSIYLGITALSLHTIRTSILERLGERQFLGTTYSLISHNCNHFSYHFALELGIPKNKVPTWPNRLAHLAGNLSCLIPNGVDVPIGNAVPQGNNTNNNATPLLVMDEPRKPPRVASL